MPISVTCPSEDEVACFMEGGVESAVAERIRSHLDSCDSCRKLLVSALRVESLESHSTMRISEPRTFPVGAILNRRFRLERFIARGGMGEVYEAWDLELCETVALKTIVCTGLDNARLFPRIRAEVQIARRITHPNVCRILEFGVAETVSHDYVEAIPFFTMEYLRGNTLKEHLARCGRMAESELIPIVVQILDGLSAVHAAGIVHRDLKPENVFLVPTDTGLSRAVVMDFGLARSTVAQDAKSGFSSDLLVGTPAYMAPEQTVGGPPAATWDIYAVGVLAFELLTGTLPFSGKTAVAMAMARVGKPAPLMSTVQPEVHPTIDSLVDRCLQADPKRRFTDAAAARSAFAAVGLSSRPRRWFPSANRRTLAIAVAGIVVSVGFAVQLSIRDESEPTRWSSVPRIATETRSNDLRFAATWSSIDRGSVDGSPASVTNDATSMRLEPLRQQQATESGPNRNNASKPRRQSVNPVPVHSNAPATATSQTQVSDVDSGTGPRSATRRQDADEVAIPAFARSSGNDEKIGIP